MQRYSSKVFGNKTNLVVEQNGEQDSGFSAASLSMRAQKKIASKLSTRKVTKLFISQSVDRVFDNLYNALRTYYSKKDSEKVLKNIIKLVVKIGLLARNDMLSETDIKQLENVQKQLHSLALTIISFVQVKYSFERTHLIELLKSMQQSLTPLVTLRLSDKSTRRLEHVITHLPNSNSYLCAESTGFESDQGLSFLLITRHSAKLSHCKKELFTSKKA
uniref:Uncharacterized protein n=1 Tax=Haemonchus contortus TaxID=6289 RepID=W6NBX9_HAECO